MRNVYKEQLLTVIKDCQSHTSCSLSVSHCSARDPAKECKNENVSKAGEQWM